MNGPEVPRMALACGEPHPLVPELLCHRLSGHGGLHGADDGNDWNPDWGVANGETK